jgi:hypothetical protein
MALTFNQVKPATAPQEQAPAPKNDAGMVNVTIRVDADCYLLCDGEFMEDIQIVANQIIKAKLPVGQHLLEFMDMENPDIKVEKAVDFPDEGKSYLLLVTGLQANIQETNQKKIEKKLSPQELYEKGETCWENEDYEAAVKWYLKSAEQGYAEAQHDLGYCYQEGVGISHDSKEAVKWYRKAAEQGFVEAQFELALCYVNGDGVPKDDAESIRWYYKAAEQGHAIAQNNLGVHFHDAKGFNRNYAEALKWYYKAAEQGVVNSLYGIGLCFENGQGVPKNVTEAVKWYRKAAEKGFELAKLKLAALDN